MDSADFSPNARDSLFKKTFSLDKQSSEQSPFDSIKKKHGNIMKTLGLGGVKEHSEENSEDEHDINNPISSGDQKVSSYSDCSVGNLNTDIQQRKLALEMRKSSSMSFGGAPFRAK